MVAPIATQKDQAALDYARTLSNVPWCDDYEKMVSGMLYSCMSPELLESRNRARRIAQRFNTWVPDDALSAVEVGERRIEMIRGLFGKIGADSYVEPNLQVDYGCNISVGKNFYANFKYAPSAVLIW